MWSVRLSLVGQWCSLRQWQILTEYRDKGKRSNHLQPIMVSQGPLKEICFAPAGAILRPQHDGAECERNNSADTLVSEEGAGRGVPGTGAEVPLQPMERTVVEQAGPLHPMVYHSGAHIRIAALKESSQEQTPTRTFSPWMGFHTGACDMVGASSHAGGVHS